MIHNFGWIPPGRMAGFGLSGELTAANVRTLERAGVGALVSLTEEAARPLPPGLRYLHLPVPDMTVPSPRQIDRFLEFVDAAEEDGLAVAVHCRAGLGRTGTMLACYLVSRGRPAEEALEQVRRQRPGSVETAGQEEAVRACARRRAGRNGRGA